MRKKRVQKEEKRQAMELQAGFYLVNGQDGSLVTRTVTKGKGEARETVEVPIRARTINSARELISLKGEGYAILCAPHDGFIWGSLV
jgi:hypothetical protein